MRDCVFCQILAGASPASVVYQDELVCAFADLHPIQPGHVLVVPRRHTRSWSSVPASTAHRLIEIAQRVAAALRNSDPACCGVNLFLADGACAGQEVDHVHLHVIPRHPEDGFGLRVPRGYGKPAARRDLDRIADRIRSALNLSRAESAFGKDGSPNDMVHATLCFLVSKEARGRVLLGRKKRGFGVGKLNGIGGKLTEGESPEEGVVREVQEEVGVHIPRRALRYAGQITFRFPFRREFDHFVHVFVASEWQGEPTESAEMAPAWYSLCDLPFDQMWQDDAYWLPLVLNGKTIRAVFTFADDNETVVSWSLTGLETSSAEGDGPTWPSSAA